MLLLLITSFCPPEHGHSPVSADCIAHAQVASATNDVAGDGTTTATVLTRAILVEGCKSVAAGMNPMDLRRGINLAVRRERGGTVTVAFARVFM